jgi:hypothetical protein
VTDAEELELLELENKNAIAKRARVAQTQMPAAAPAVTLGAGSTGAFHAARHLSFGLGDKIIAGVQALNDYRQDKTGQSLGDIYSRDLAYNDQLIEDSDQAHPRARWVGNAIGFGGNLAALAAMAPARAALAARGIVPAAARTLAAPTLLGRVLQGVGEGARTGAALGAVGGFGASRSDNPLLNTAVGAGFGTLTGGVLGGLGGAVASKIAARQSPTPLAAATIADLAKETNQPLPMVARGVVPDPEAQVLQKYGVPLTLGQMQPGGVASEAEEAALRVPMLGKAVEGQRKAAEQGWRDAVINTTRGPVEGPVGPGGAIEKLHRIKQGFTTAYDQIADRPAAALASHPQTGGLVHPREAFDAILSDPSYQAGGEDLGVVRRVLGDQLLKMERAQEAGQPIKAGMLMDMRSALREAAQTARLNGNFSTSQMFQDAADSVTGGLRGTQLPRDLALLDRTDAAYSKFMKVVGAAARAGGSAEEGEFGPKQLSAELQKAYGRRFATDPNAGGELRDLARAGKYAFTPQDSKTGHGETLKHVLGLGLGPQVFRANADPATQTLFMLAAQRAAQSAPRMLPPAAGEIEQTLAGFLNRAPVTASSVSPAISSLQDLLNGSRQR